jgi:hypothetical protein
VAGRFCVVPESRETDPQTWNEGLITLFHQCQIFSQAGSEFRTEFQPGRISFRAVE